MKTIALLVPALLAFACSGADAPSESWRASAKALTCYDHPEPVWLVRTPDLASEVTRAQYLIDKLLALPQRGHCAGGGGCILGPETCDWTTCQTGACPGWTCTQYGQLTADDGRVGTIVVDSGVVQSALLDAGNTNLTESERSELSVYQAAAGAFMHFYCSSWP